MRERTFRSEAMERAVQRVTNFHEHGRHWDGAASVGVAAATDGSDIQKIAHIFS